MTQREKTKIRRSLIRRLLRGASYVPPVIALMSTTTIAAPDPAEAAGADAVKTLLQHRTGKGEFVTICVAPSAVPAHLAHGDVELGEC